MQVAFKILNFLERQKVVSSTTKHCIVIQGRKLKYLIKNTLNSIKVVKKKLQKTKIAFYCKY